MTFAVVFQLRAGNSSNPPFQFVSVNVTVSAKADDSEVALPLTAEAADAGAVAGDDLGLEPAPMKKD